MDIKSLIDDAEKLHEAKKYNEAIKKLDEALSKTKNNDNTYYYIDALRHIGHLYFTIAEELKKTSEKIITYKKSIKSYKKQLKIIKENKEKEELIHHEINSNLNIGINYYYMIGTDKTNLLNKAIIFFNKVLKLSKKLNNIEENLIIKHITIGYLSLCHIIISIENKDEDFSEKQYKLYQNHLISFTKLTSKAKRGKAREENLFSVIKEICFKATYKKQRSFLDYNEIYLYIKTMT